MKGKFQPVKNRKAGLHYDENLIISFWRAWRLSNCTITPDGKSWLEQDPIWWSDVFTIDDIAQYEAYQIEQAHKK